MSGRESGRSPVSMSLTQYPLRTCQADIVEWSARMEGKAVPPNRCNRCNRCTFPVFCISGEGLPIAASKSHTSWQSTPPQLDPGSPRRCGHVIASSELSGCAGAELLRNLHWLVTRVFFVGCRMGVKQVAKYWKWLLTTRNLRVADTLQWKQSWHWPCFCFFGELVFLRHPLNWRRKTL
jgi:hypothetical protein